MKVYLKIVIGIIFVLLIILVGVLYSKNKQQCAYIDYLDINNYALLQETDSLSNRIIEYKHTIKDLMNSKDSINIKLTKTIKELNIKESKIRNLQYMVLESQRTDTLKIKDTLFRDRDFRLDTVIKDDWYQASLTLEYPGTIILTPSFKNEITVIASARREILEPKDCFIARWFQKKSTIVEVVVHDESPYSTLKQKRFVEIIK